mmetsp:Transcript_33252/g.40214  ORF Transcript_33252/g.40214 Transcript_33252/m.40214 type:complete len:346 (-) Transcript_33252:429-1466(-)|eukprot:CAMPEP_0197863390 /NCGR_PEP_ID=MMETSP1438-20131217/40815_1 /TAXON_ID=1461541 /ORGANISM="Pterosperma sp., Strain CCMP1384" /LENGTH=345 /DNA_ID=CAMNT_0043481267 /DNA_START=337 /DNA_END=1374 /DNA_ORIENTATION=-
MVTTLPRLKLSTIYDEYCPNFPPDGFYSVRDIQAVSTASPPEPDPEPVDVTVIGGGRMGCAIAGQLALKGLCVTMYDHTEFTRARALEMTMSMLQEMVNSKLLGAPAARKAADNLKVVPTMEEALHKASIAFEAIPEVLQQKQKLFRIIDALSPPHTIMASNTINFLPDHIQGTHKFKHKLCGIRFLHPVILIDKVEITALRDDALFARVWSLLHDAGMDPYGYTDGPRTKLSQSEVERIYAEQRENLALSSPSPQDLIRSPDAHSDDDTHLCVICLDAPKDCILHPCGHREICSQCLKSLKLTKCPVCRAKVERTLPVFQISRTPTPTKSERSEGSPQSSISDK